MVRVPLAAAQREGCTARECLCLLSRVGCQSASLSICLSVCCCDSYLPDCLFTSQLQAPDSLVSELFDMVVGCITAINNNKLMRKCFLEQQAVGEDVIEQMVADVAAARAAYEAEAEDSDEDAGALHDSDDDDYAPFDDGALSDGDEKMPPAPAVGACLGDMFVF